MGTPDLAVACPLTSQPRPRPRAEPAGPVGRESRACLLGDSRHTASCCAARAGSQPQRGQGGGQRPHTGGQLMAASAGAGRGQPHQAQRHSGNQRPSHCPEAAGLGSWCPAVKERPRQAPSAPGLQGRAGTPHGPRTGCPPAQPLLQPKQTGKCFPLEVRVIRAPRRPWG